MANFVAKIFKKTPNLVILVRDWNGLQKREKEDRNNKRKVEIAKNLAEKAKAIKKRNKKTPSEELERLKKQEDIDPSLILSNKKVAEPR